VGWAEPRAGTVAARGARGLRLLSFGSVLRFLQCPLQGSARALLPVGDDDAEEEATAAFREHEDFDLSWGRAVPLLKEALGRAFGAAGEPDDAALARALDEATAL